MESDAYSSYVAYGDVSFGAPPAAASGSGVAGAASHVDWNHDWNAALELPEDTWQQRLAKVKQCVFARARALAWFAGSASF